MKSLRIATLSLLVVLCAAPAHADSIDPHFKTGGGGGTGDPVRPGAAPVPAGIITPDFTISSASGASPATSPCVLIQGGLMTSTPQCLFENDISQNGVPFAITQLVFDVAGINFHTVTCGFLAGSPFANCAVGMFGDGGTMVTFNGGSIPFHTDFTLEFGSPTDPFPPHTSTTATATLSPEPGTLALFLAGIGALLIGRRLRARSLS